MSQFTRVLVLDDDETRQRYFRQALIGMIVDHAYTASEAIQKLIDHSYDCVMLDHDLGGKTMVVSGKGTGFEVAQWLRDNPHRMPKQIIIHSFNPVGAQNIKNILPGATMCPGAWSRIKDGKISC